MRELVSCGVEIILDKFVIGDDKYPSVPRPCIVEKSVADEMKLDGTVEMYPRVPKPTNELVSCGVEIILDNERDDR